MNLFRITPWVAVLCMLGTGSRAEVLDVAPQGFSVRSTVEVSATPDRAYQIFVGKVSSWWHPDHTFFGTSEYLSIQPEAQGCFCERTPAGSEVRHLTVVFVDPGKGIRMLGGLGPLQELGLDGAMSVVFLPIDEGGAQVELTYRVSGYSKGGLERLAGPVDHVLSEQLSRYRNFVETGEPG